MKKYLICIIILLFLCAPSVLALEPVSGSLREAYIKWQSLGWQTYEFGVLSNQLPDGDYKYEWNIDNRELYNTPSVRAFLSRGDHLIKVKISDAKGNVRYDSVSLQINFWSLQNNWIWWGVYAITMLLVFYYWLLKLILFWQRRRLSRGVKNFLSLLDGHDWQAKVVSHHNFIPKKKK